MTDQRDLSSVLTFRPSETGGAGVEFAVINMPIPYKELFNLAIVRDLPKDI